MNTLRNKVNLIGRIGTNPELQKVGNGKDYTITRFPLATNESYKDKNGQWHDNTQWHNLQAWGKVAERIAKSVKKGQELMIEGRVVQKMYEKEGEKRYTTEIEVTDFILLAQRNTEKEEDQVEEVEVKKSK